MTIISSSRLQPQTPRNRNVNPVCAIRPHRKNRYAMISCWVRKEWADGAFFCRSPRLQQRFCFRLKRSPSPVRNRCLSPHGRLLARRNRSRRRGIRCGVWIIIWRVRGSRWLHGGIGRFGGFSLRSEHVLARRTEVPPMVEHGFS